MHNHHPIVAKAVSPKQAARSLGIGPTTLYKLLAECRLRSVRVGRRRLVLVESIDALLSGQREQSQVSHLGR